MVLAAHHVVRRDDGVVGEVSCAEVVRRGEDRAGERTALLRPRRGLQLTQSGQRVQLFVKDRHIRSFVPCEHLGESLMVSSCSCGSGGLIAIGEEAAPGVLPHQPIDHRAAVAFGWFVSEQRCHDRQWDCGRKAFAIEDAQRLDRLHCAAETTSHPPPVLDEQHVVHVEVTPLVGELALEKRRSLQDGVVKIEIVTQPRQLGGELGFHLLEAFTGRALKFSDDDVVC